MIYIYNADGKCTTYDNLRVPYVLEYTCLGTVPSYFGFSEDINMILNREHAKKYFIACPNIYYANQIIAEYETTKVVNYSYRINCLDFRSGILVYSMRILHAIQPNQDYHFYVKINFKKN